MKEKITDLKKKKDFLSVARHGVASYDTLNLRGFSGFLTD